MHAERDYLVKQVFPELRDWCERRKLRLVDIDLRWGVTEQDALYNKNVVKVCLDRIDDCRPFFLCFLGQRRGWVPGEEDISAATLEEFPGLKEYAGNTSVTEMEILHALVNPLHRSKPHDPKKPAEYYDPTKYAFFYLRDDAYLKQLPVNPPQLRQTYTNESVLDETERAIHDNELNRWRNVVIPGSGRPFHRYETHWDSRLTTPELLLPLQCPSTQTASEERWRSQWKQAGVTVKGTNVLLDPAQAENAREFSRLLSTGRLTGFEVKEKALSQVIVTELREAIAARFPDHIEVPEETDLQNEMDQQEQFLFVSSEGYIRREGDFTALDAYVDGDSNQMFALTAPGGMGKSTLLANWIELYRSRNADKRDQSIHFRFIGQSDRSTKVYSLLNFLLREMKEVSAKFTEAIPEDPQKLRQELPKLLEAAGRRGKTVIVLDALNQLESGLTDLAWLPSQLPKNVKLIVSFKRGDPAAEELYQRMQGQVVLSNVRPFVDLEDRRSLVKAYLSQYLKNLDERHLETLIQTTGAENPLFLKVVLSELRVFGAFANLGEKIRSDFGETPVSAFQGVLKRLENDPAYSPIDPKQAVPLLFGLLAHTRQGLSADELTALFVQTLRLEDNEAERQAAADSIYLYLRQVRPFLALRDNRNDFFYESFKLAALNRYVAKEDSATDWPQETTVGWHAMLAGYFGGLHTWENKEQRIPNRRKTSELPFHQTLAKLAAAVEKTLTDLDFIEAKCTAGMANGLIEDYDRIGAGSAKVGPPIRTAWLHAGRYGVWCPYCQEWCEVGVQLLGEVLPCPSCRSKLKLNEFFVENPWQPTPKGSGKTGKALEILSGQVSQPLTEFSDFIHKWIYVLKLYPELTWQQAFNGPDSLAPAKLAGQKLAADTGKTPWIRWKNKPDYQENTSLNLHFLPIKHGSFAIKGASWSLDGERVLIINPDQVIGWFNARNGQKILEFDAPTKLDFSWQITWMTVNTEKVTENKIVAWSLSPDEKYLLLAITNKYDASQEDKEKGAESPYEIYLQSGAYRYTSEIILVDVLTGKEIKRFKGHDLPITDCKISPDGQRYVTGSKDKTLKIWDIQTGQEICTLTGHTGGIACCAFSPDGKQLISCSSAYIHPSLRKDYSDECAIILWDVATGKKLYEASNIWVLDHRGCCFSPSGRYIAFSAGSNQTNLVSVKVLDFQSLQVIAELDTGHPENCVFSPDGRFILLNCGVWNWQENKLLKLSAGSCPEFSPDGQRILIPSNDDLTVINITDPVKFQSLDLTAAPQQDYPAGFAISRGEYFWLDNQAILQYAHEGIVLFDADSCKIERSLMNERNKLGGTVYATAFLPRAKQILANKNVYNTGSAEIVLINRDDFNIIWRAEIRKGSEDWTSKSVISISPDGSQAILAKDGHLATYGAAGNISVPQRLPVFTILDLTPGKEAVARNFSLPDLNELPGVVEYSPDGRWLFINTKTGFQIRDSASWEIIHTFTTSNTAMYKPLPFACTPDCRAVWLGFTNNLGEGKFEYPIKLINILTGREIASYPCQAKETYTHDNMVSSISADGQWLINESRNIDKSMCFLDARSGEMINPPGVFPGQGVFLSGRGIALTMTNQSSIRKDASLMTVWQVPQAKQLASLFLESGEGIEVNPLGDEVLLLDHGRNLVFKLENCTSGIPIVTALYLFEPFTGQWKNNLSINCPNCRTRFEPISQISKRIDHWMRDFSPDQVPSLAVSIDAFSDPTLVCECSTCHQAMRVNPFTN